MRFHKTLAVFLITNLIFRSVASIFVLYKTYIQGIVHCKHCGSNDLVVGMGDSWSYRQMKVWNCNQTFNFVEKFLPYQAKQAFVEANYKCPFKQQVIKKLYTNCTYKDQFESYICDYTVIDM
uniref:Secreted protein n=1 Tax=Strongyloides venezuelensis TaxID=75913 RepID=A0A0K0FEP0_STRVS